MASQQRRSGLKPVSDSTMNSLNSKTSRLSIGPQRVTKPAAQANDRKSMIPAPRHSMGISMTVGRASEGGALSQPQSRPSMGFGGRPSIGQGRPSIGQGRPSTARRSSVYGERSGMKDTRALGDKEYRKQCCMNLIRFLSANEYPHPISLKLLTAPMMKDFLRIFQFLYNLIDPGHKFTATNFTEEIPLLMKGVRYPFVIKQSALFSWTPHTWPSLLGALHWLVELCTYMQRIGPTPYFHPAGEDGFAAEAPSDHERLFTYMAKAYMAYMQGAQDFAHLEEDLAFFTNRNMELRERNMRLQGEIDELSRELELHHTQPPRLEQLSLMKEEHVSDLTKFRKFIEDCENRLGSRTRKHDEKLRALQEAEEELSRVLQEAEMLRGALARQELSQTDVKRINLERQQLLDHLNEAGQQRENADRLILDRELLINESMEHLERAVYEYHRVAERLHIVPASARHANGLDLELRMAMHDPQPDQMISVHIKGTIKPSLHHLKDACVEKSRECHEEEIELQEKLEQLTDEASEYADRIASLEGKVARADGQYRDKRDVLGQASRAWTSEVEELEEVVRQLVVAVNDGQLDRLAVRAEEIAQRQAREATTFSQLIIFSLNDATAHKQHIADRIRGLQEQAWHARERVQMLG